MDMDTMKKSRMGLLLTMLAVPYYLAVFGVKTVMKTVRALASSQSLPKQMGNGTGYKTSNT